MRGVRMGALRKCSSSEVGIELVRMGYGEWELVPGARAVCLLLRGMGGLVCRMKTRVARMSTARVNGGRRDGTEGCWRRCGVGVIGFLNIV